MSAVPPAFAKAAPAFAKASPALAVALALAACTPKAAPVASAEPINGIVESISDTLIMVSDSAATDADTGVAAVALPPDHPLALTPAQEAHIDSLISVMTVAEKVGQMNQYTSFYDVTGPPPTEGNAEARFEQVRSGLVGSMLNVTGAAATRTIQELAMESRLGIPLIFGFDVIHGFRTQFPVPLAEAASWDLALIESGARWAAQEAAANGIHWTFAPMVDVSPDARWGRIVEGAGEDPYYGSLVAAARVRGFQGDDLSADSTVAACTKHFAGYGFAEAGRDYNTVDVSDYTLYNVILPPFRAAAEAGSATFMNGFNTLGGVPVTGDGALQRTWLKGELGWPGFIVSDWNSIGEMVAHGFAADRKDAARKAALAGSDMDMETTAYVNDLPGLVAEGAVDTSVLDESVRRILRVKTALGLFEDPYRYSDTARQRAVTGSPAILAATRRAAAASAVLLKNDGDILPLAPSGTERILVIGDLAASTNDPLGTWSLGAERNSAVSLVDALRAGLDNSTRLTYLPGPATLTPESKRDFLYDLKVNTTDRAGLDEAVAAAREADVVLLALGEPGFMTGEARSRTDISLPGLQHELAMRVLEANPNTAVILYTGRPLTLDSLVDAAPAILVAWQPGSHGNLGIADLVYGAAAPAGKLSVSFPFSVGQEPLTYRTLSTGRPRLDPDPEQMVFTTHYMDAPNGPAFPFGHGLTYTTFEVGTPTLSQNTLSSGGTVTLTATVRNTGQRAGTETVQLYINDPVAERARPVRELRGFERVTLEPGASQSVSFEITPETLQYWTPEAAWHTEPGAFRLMVGTSSAELGEPLEITMQ